MMEIRLPQLGEGLREARIVQLLCAEGTRLARGTPIYLIETDKSMVELESPLDGRLLEWRVGPGDVVGINSIVAIAAPDAVAAEPEVKPQRLIPPRTRAYAEQMGIPAALLDSIPAASNKVLPADIDAFIKGSTAGAAADRPFVERRVVGAQRALIYRLRRSAGLVIPGTVATSLPWDSLVRRARACEGPRPSPFQVLSHAVAQLAGSHAAFRSVMVGDDRIRQFDRANLGVAIARPGDELVIALVRDAGGLALGQYVRACAAAMRRALRQGDQAADDMQILVSHLGEYDVQDAIPALVAPASSVFFLGAPDRHSGLARVVLTFDHRLINGAGAGRFLSELAGSLG